MPSSLVIQLISNQGGMIHGGTSRAVHGFWYQHWLDIDSDTSNHLHQFTETPPFTLSPLMDLPFPRKGRTVIPHTHTAWFRAAVLTEDLAKKMQDQWISKLPETIMLAGVEWTVDSWTLSKASHPWAGQESYEELTQKYLFNPDPPTSWNLKFITPTTFHGEVGHLPFPLPDSLISGWLRRWQAFAPMGFPADLPEMARNHLVVSAYRLKTVPVRHGKRLTVGCVGDYRLLALDLPAPYRAAIDLLAHYASFVGSGHRTTQGMGMTELQPDK